MNKLYQMKQLGKLSLNLWLAVVLNKVERWLPIVINAVSNGKWPKPYQGSMTKTGHTYRTTMTRCGHTLCKLMTGSIHGWGTTFGTHDLRIFFLGSQSYHDFLLFDQ